MKRIKQVERALESYGRDYKDPAKEIHLLFAELEDWQTKCLELTMKLNERQHK